MIMREARGVFRRSPSVEVVASDLTMEIARMRVTLIAVLAAAGMGLLALSTTSAAPINGAGIAAAANETSVVGKTRLYCYRHYTNTSRKRFLHWGRC
jgi:hypothetical protein